MSSGLGLSLGFTRSLALLLYQSLSVCISLYLSTSTNLALSEFVCGPWFAITVIITIGRLRLYYRPRANICAESFRFESALWFARSASLILGRCCSLFDYCRLTGNSMQLVAELALHASGPQNLRGHAEANTRRDNCQSALSLIGAHQSSSS